ncbi:hypothetical protein HAX54_053474, partial [Datura stramonium]|nr:hypothetical protein [Datura stramonium]
MSAGSSGGLVFGWDDWFGSGRRGWSPALVRREKKGEKMKGRRRPVVFGGGRRNRGRGFGVAASDLG